MSRCETEAGTRYVKVTFDADELNVIRTACATVSGREHDKSDAMAGSGLERAARQARKASDAEMTDKLVSLFRAGEEVLIECEDLAPVLESLKAYEPDVSDEQAGAFKRAREKIRRCCG